MDIRLIQMLPDEGEPRQLMILLHGVGARADDLAPLAHALRPSFPQAAFLLPDGFEPFDAHPTLAGRQWFSIRDVTDENRPARVAAAVPGLVELVRACQRHTGVGEAATALIGFSQGSIMALEACAAEPGLAGRVLAFAGRYATLPAAVSPLTSYHFLHGSADPVIDAAHARAAFEHVGRLEGGDATLDIAEGVGHELHASLVDRALFRLTHHVPVRMWQEALGGASHPGG
ncbi:MAG: hypothetical protein RL456_239 [Pseudomonadota bacterium]|jgi:phospholipase/carboxylesterase